MALILVLILSILVVPLAGALALLRRLLLQMPLRKVPGPANASLLTGAYVSLLQVADCLPTVC